MILSVNNSKYNIFLNNKHQKINDKTSPYLKSKYIY